jgi:iron complex transport system substrate-binding protein
MPHHLPQLTEPEAGRRRTGRSAGARRAARVLAATVALATTSATLTATSAASADAATQAALPDAAAPYPVTIDNCGTTITFDAAPTRAVSNDIPTTDDMLALGLGPRMVGDFGVAKSKKWFAEDIDPAYTAAFDKVKDVSSDYFTLEQLVGLHPDFLFAGWSYGLQVGTSLTPQHLATFGIKTLALTESCAHVQSSKQTVSIDNTYEDLTNLGKIFDVESRANALIHQMQATVAGVESKVAGLPKVTVAELDADNSGAPLTAPGLAMPTSLMALGGGQNIFASLEQTWTTVSWEQVVAKDPQCIIIDTYGTPEYQSEKSFLETSAITKNLTAVKNRCFLGLTYDEVTPSPRNAQTVVAIAHWLHPEAFGLPADGS